MLLVSCHLGSVRWGQEQGDIPCCWVPTQEPQPPSQEKFCFFPLDSLLPGCSVRAEQAEFKALKGKVKGKPLIGKIKETRGVGAFRSALHKVQDSRWPSGMDPASAPKSGYILEGEDEN